MSCLCNSDCQVNVQIQELHSSVEELKCRIAELRALLEQALADAGTCDDDECDDEWDDESHAFHAAAMLDDECDEDDEETSSAAVLGKRCRSKGRW